MENLKIEKTNYTPEIDFDCENGILNIVGKSYPENTFELYAPIHLWLKEYLGTTSIDKIIVNLALTYLNSSSLKSYFDMFDMFESAHENGKNIEINWIYESDDDIIEETGEDFKADFGELKINLIARDS